MGGKRALPGTLAMTLLQMLLEQWNLARVDYHSTLVELLDYKNSPGLVDPR